VLALTMTAAATIVLFFYSTPLLQLVRQLVATTS